MRHFFFCTILFISTFSTILTCCTKESGYESVSDTVKIAIVFQPDSANGKDAIIESITANKNFGNSANFTMFSWTNGGFFDTARSLIEFNLTVIPAQTVIKRATLSLYFLSYQNITEHTGDNAFTISQITRKWNEDSVCWSNQPTTINLNVVVPKSWLSYQSYTIDISTIAQDMINHPSDNHGFMLKLVDEFPFRSVVLASSDYSVSSKRPKLVVYY